MDSSLIRSAKPPRGRLIAGTIVFVSVLICLLPYSSTVVAQELEPRALTNIPLRTNFFIVGYAYANGNILLDPSLPIEDFNGKFNSMVFAYARAVNFFGKSGKIDASLPFAGGDWKGVFDGDDFEDHSTGFGDLRIRASINLTGAPALKLSDYSGYKQETVSGLSFQMIIPTGNYKSDQPYPPLPRGKPTLGDTPGN